MPKARKILIVVEGKTAEAKLLNKALECYGIDKPFQLFPYEANIDMFYQDICNPDGSIPDDLDTMRVLVERERKLHPDFEKDSAHVLLQRYTDIIFVLDLDPHHSEEAAQHALRMAEYFVNSTDEGKLFVNHPMLESYRHLLDLPDPAYLHRTVDLECCNDYKAIVGSEALATLTQLSRYTKSTFDQVISHNYFKATRLLGEASLDLETCEASLVRVQLAMLEAKGAVAVLNTCLFFILDYWPSLVELDNPYADEGANRP